MEGITKKQKGYLIKWTVIAGVICGIISAGGLFVLGTSSWKETGFWLQIVIVAMGGGYVFGFLPAVLSEYRKTSNE